MNRLHFRVEALATGSRARATTFQTAHNVVQTPLFMPVGTQATVKAQLPQNAGGCRLADPARQHLPSAAAAGRGGLPPPGRHPPLHELAQECVDRLRRVPDFFPAAFARHDGSGRRVPELHGRQDDPPESRAEHPHPAGHRQRHHDGAGPVRAVHGGRGHRTRGPGHYPPLGRPQPGRAGGRLAAISVRDRPGGALPRTPPGERAVPRRAALRWVCHRRLGRGREQGAAGRHLRVHDRPAAPRPAALPDGCGHAAGHPRSRAPGRGHVRLHHPDPGGAARRGVHLARLPATAPGRVQVLRGTAGPGVPLPDVRPVFPRLPAPPHQDQGNAGLATARPAQHSLLSSADARDSRQHPGRLVPGTVPGPARDPARGRPRQPDLRPGAEAGQTPAAGRLRGPCRARRFRERPADFLRRDHARAHPAVGKKRGCSTSSRRAWPSGCE